MMNKKSAIDLSFLLNIRTQWMLGVIVFFLTALGFGMGFGTLSGYVPTILWILFGGITLACISQAFPDAWNYIFWLAGIYGATVGGTLCLLGLKLISSPLFTALGVFLIIVALAIVIYLILHIKSIRDEISGVIERADKNHIEHEVSYVPLGFWTISVLLFFVFSICSILGWARWAIDHQNLGIYIFSEVMVLSLGLYILWVPQTKFEWGFERLALEPEIISSPKSKLVIPIPRIFEDKTAPETTSNICPICNSNLIQDKRTCAKCGTAKTFSWCKTSETYIINCPVCNKSTSYSRDECMKCGKPFSKLIECQCGTKKPIKDWKLPAA